MPFYTLINLGVKMFEGTWSCLLLLELLNDRHFRSAVYADAPQRLLLDKGHVQARARGASQKIFLEK